MSVALAEAGFIHRLAPLPEPAAMAVADAVNDSDQIRAALTQLARARRAFQKAIGDLGAGRRGAAARLDAAEQVKDLARAEVERAVRVANPGASPDVVAAVTNNLTR
jgi:hypothetical protein